MNENEDMNWQRQRVVPGYKTEPNVIPGRVMDWWVFTIGWLSLFHHHPSSFGF